VSNNSSIVACVFVTGAKFYELLPSNNRGIHIQTHRLEEGNFKYGVDMGSNAVIYVPSFIKIGSGIKKCIKEGYADTQTAR
jgi:hypothetical protein